ncbi:MAG: RnfABCDGE type electron transport complex subunit G [Desulfuromonadales bacterium]|nr:RnfABCDGE type electron transport complex subunit G [Desulfuromonadales bacterium]MDW7756124.1 RnfABCDGE type electron transport complex subunit G [Desulfuromonadales bacterium]
MKEIGRLALVLTLIAAGAALILSLVEAVTRAPIAETRRQETLKAIRAVLPADINNSPDEDTVALIAGQDKKGRDVVNTFYRGRKEGQMAGVAFKVVAPDGYSGNITIMVGVLPDGRVHGIEILSHAETPGLGDAIELPWFKEQFSGKSLESADWRVKKDGGQFDQITGATISPRAVVGAVKKGLEFFSSNRAEILTSGEGVK